MAIDQPRWWQSAIDASPGQALALEAAAGQQQRFAELDNVKARLLTGALRGRPVVFVTRGIGPEQPDTVEVVGLTADERALCVQEFGVREQQQRGAWYLPQKLSLKAGAVNLPHLLRQRSAHALTLAGDDTARVTVVDGADTVMLWGLLLPLFETLMEPVRVRAAGPTGSREEQQQLWSGIAERYRRLGIDSGALDAFRFGGGWHRLDRAGQQQARLHLLDALAATDPLQIVTRHRIMQVQSLMAAFAKKAKTGTALARRVLTRALQPVVSGYFGGDWLAVLDYLQVPAHPDEEIITALPEPRLYVGMSAQAAGVAADAGIPEAEVHAMLAAFLGGSTSLSPVEERTAALREWWTAFDRLHAAQQPGMRSLWGLVDDNLMALDRQDDGVFTPQLYRQALPADVTDGVNKLWHTVTLPRHPRSIVSNPRPHQLMAETFGPAVEFWHGVALTAWFVCEGPYSRASLSGVADYYNRALTALDAAGCPVDSALFDELRSAEQRLGPEEHRTVGEDIPVDTFLGSFTLTSSLSTGTRRKGFEHVRDVITRHRRAWADQYLAGYLQQRWRTALEQTARDHHQFVAAKGRPPTLIQFAKFAAGAANQWTGGNFGDLYTAIGEPAPAQQDHPARLLTVDGYDFARRIYTALGGRHLDTDTRINQPEQAQRHWQLSRLAVESLRYLQLHEALGQPPTAQQFGTQRLVWPWPGEETEGWPIFQRTIAALTHTRPPGPTPLQVVGEGAIGAEQRPGDQTKSLAKGANALLHDASVTVRIAASGEPVDVSAVLLTSNGKVRDDHDLVFYNHPAQDGVHTDGHTVTADLPRIPHEIHSIAVIVSIDLAAPPGAVFDQHTTWQADITQPSGTALCFKPQPFTARETVAIAVEIYRHTTGWKARAVAHGYDTGLAGLATDYGIAVDS